MIFIIFCIHMGVVGVGLWWIPVNDWTNELASERGRKCVPDMLMLIIIIH